MLNAPFVRQPLAFAVCAVLLLSACNTVPTSGPSLSKVTNLSKEPTTDEAKALPRVEVIDMTDAISAGLSGNPTNESLVDLDGRGAGVDAVGLGDVLEVTIWEAPPAVLFGGAINSAGSGTAQVIKLPEQLVGENGLISIPFVGQLSVKGKTPAQIQQNIVASLKRKANQPQALVRVVQNNSANITVIRAGRSVRMPLTAHRERILDAVAAVGGVETGVQEISLQLTRGNQVRTISLETVTANPSENIVLRSGDVLTMMATPLSFTALGAVGKNQQIRFAARGMNLGEAMGEMGGLQDRRADARGVFVFRYQPLSSLPEQKRQAWLAKGFTPRMDIPVVYRVNLKDPHSLFWLQRIQMRDKDIVYVANAPTAELQKFLQFVLSPVTSSFYNIERIAN
ncbi:polysaccharide biosynthesis/export family protein [Neisseriaceae bacterium B1]